MAANMDGKQKVVAAAQQIVKSLNSSRNVDTNDMILLLSEFDTRLSNFNDIMLKSSSSSTSSATPSDGVSGRVGGGGGGGPLLESSDEGGEDDGDDDLLSPVKDLVDPRFEEAEQLILSWEASGGGTDGEYAYEDYLAAVDEIIQCTEELGGQSAGFGGGSEGDWMDRAEKTLQLAMTRLEDEFRQILIRNTAPLDPERLHGSMIRRSSLSSSHSGDGITEIPDFDTATAAGSGATSFAQHDDISSDRYNLHVRGQSVSSDDASLCLINPDAIIELKEIADRMIRAGYEKECCQVYSSVRRDVLDECMSNLGIEKLSIDEVQRMEWKLLDEKMKKWIHAVKIVVQILLNGEKGLCEEIFTGSDLIKEVCFIETAKGCVMQLLNFGEAVAIGKKSSEKLFRLLDMYDAVADVLPHLRTLFNDESCEMIFSEAKGVMDALGEAATGTFMEFEKAVKGESSRRPIPNGEIHPLTRYVMNYVKLLVDYSDTLNSLLEKIEEESYSEDLKVNEGDNVELENTSALSIHLLSLIKSLESNLEDKSRMYDDGGLMCVFLMNNILYIVQKVKDSELRNLLGDNWIRRRRGMIRQHSTAYLRASWSKPLGCLKDEGIGGSSNASKIILKERFKNFNTCFEDIYRFQTAWKVPDLQLRDELRISISEKLIPAYRAFLGRFGSHLESGKHAGKYIKYTPEDLDDYLSHLFEGAPLILHHLRRKST